MGGYRPYILFGAVPLALAFGLLYYRRRSRGRRWSPSCWRRIFCFAASTTAVNVPLRRLTARITQDARERSAISGARMLFSTCAAVVVALATQPIAQAVTGRPDGARGFFVAACLFAAIATLVLPLVFATTR